jgi:hypothetical protein
MYVCRYVGILIDVYMHCFYILRDRDTERQKQRKHLLQTHESFSLYAGSLIPEERERDRDRNREVSVFLSVCGQPPISSPDHIRDS